MIIIENCPQISPKPRNYLYEDFIYTSKKD